MELEKEVMKFNGNTTPLLMSPPFHCSMMTSVREELREKLSSCKLNPPEFSVISDFTARPYRSESEVPELLSLQVCSRVRWDEALRYIADTDVDAMIDKINRDDIKLVLFSNPCNPTGRGITAEQARKLVTSVNALVILDEAYMDFWNESLLAEVEQYSNLIIFRTASKAVGCAALRLGFAVANETISRAIKAVKSPYNVNSFSQAAGTVVYRHKEYLQNRQKMIVKNRETLYNGLAELSETTDFRVYPSCANFVFVRTDSAAAIWEYLKEKSIVVRLMGDFLRITAGTEYEVGKVLDSIKEYFGVKS